MKYPILSFPRFHPYLDGLIAIGIACVVSVVIRRKDIEKEVENFLLLQEVEEKKKQMDEELELAAHVHETLLPDSIRTPEVDITVRYIPMSQVGGDYAKYRFLDGNRLLFFISDVTGHGVPAALLANRVHAEFERMAGVHAEPAELLWELNQFIRKDFSHASMYLSAFCGLLDLNEMKLSYSSYGHPVQYLYRAARSAVEGLPPEAGLLGMPFDEVRGAQPNRISIERGDRIFLFTDGVIETMDKNGDNFGERRLVEFLKSHPRLEDEAFNRKLVEELDQFKAGNFHDDIFIMNIKIHKSARPV